MAKVTVIVETDDQYRRAAREHETEDVGVLLARCVYALAEDIDSLRLRAVAEAVHQALNAP